RIAGQERSDDEAGLREDDREEDPVHPGSIRRDELEQLLVGVKEQVDHEATRSSACARSSFRSSMSSMPAEMRTRPSVMPMAARRSAGTEACVMVAGWEMSVSTPPRLSASACSRTLFNSRRAASSDPTSNASMP